MEEKALVQETIEYIKKFRDCNVDVSNFTPKHAFWYRMSYISLGLDLKKHGREEEAQKYFTHIQKLIKNPKVKPIDDGELRNIEKFLKEKIGSQ